MKKFYSGVLNCKKTVLIIFLSLFVFSLLCSNLVAVNYDMTDYLPANTKSTVSLEILQGEFSGGIPNARVMVKDVSIPEALKFKEKIKAVEGVTEVTWLDDTADIRVPLATLDTKMVETYYRDNTAVFTVTIDDDYRISAVEDIRNLYGTQGAITGAAVSNADATVSAVSEILKITVIAVTFVLIVLLLTTSSWLEPILVLAGLGIAVVLNNGSNLIFGEISFVTNAAGSVLQLAVSLDYSVFLLHRFDECLKENNDPKAAMVDALCKSTSSILSSGLTTVIGFLALCLMQFRLGVDLGLALAKGIAISLITVFVFMPVLTVTAHKWLEKTRHKPILPTLSKFGKIVGRVAVPLTCVFALIIIPSYLGSNANSFLYGASDMFGEDTQYSKDKVLIEAVFGQDSTYVLMVPKGDTVTETALSKELHTIPEIKSIISYVDLAGAEIPKEYLDADTLALLESENYSRMVLNVDVPPESEETFAFVENVRAIADKYYPQENYLAGEAVSTYDLKQTVTADMVKVNLIAIGAVFLVLLITLKSLSLPLILVLCIETAIWINLSVPYFMDQPIYYIAYLIISSVQLGATVDYAILMTDRYRENRQTLDKKQAAWQTVNDVFVSIMTSGSVLTIVGLLLGYVSSIQLLAQLGVFVGRGAIFSLLIVLFVLPGLLYLFDSLVMHKKKDRMKRKVVAQ